jgi:hypothetical protein
VRFHPVTLVDALMALEEAEARVRVLREAMSRVSS